MPVCLYTSRLVIRLATQDDIPDLLTHLRNNQDFLAPFEPTRPPDFYSHRYWRSQVSRSFDQYQNGQALRLILIERDQPASTIGRIIGTVNFTNFLYYPFYCCSLGYSLAEDKQGYGLMQEALTVSIQYVFNTMQCHRIQANYMPRNRKSGNLLAKLGFRIEGDAKNYLLINGVWEDHILTSLTNTNWQAM
jgi:[ribosomal protein S5]-alanine N-acetyltransferase